MIDLDIAPPPPAAARAGWLVTLADLISLLLSFFILVYAGTALPVPAWEAAGRSLRLAFGGLADPPPPALAASSAAAGSAATLAHLAAVLTSALANDPVMASLPTAGAAGEGHDGRAGAVTVDAFDNRLVVALSRERVFYPRSGQFLEEAADMLAAVIPHLGRLGMPITVAVEAAGSDRELAFERGLALFDSLRARGMARGAPVFVLPRRDDDSGHRHRPRPCAAAAAVEDGRAVVLCLAGDGR